MRTSCMNLIIPNKDLTIDMTTPLQKDKSNFVELKELRYNIQLLCSDNETIQAQYIRRIIEIICDLVRSGFNEQIKNFIDQEDLKEMLQIIRSVLTNIIDEIFQIQTFIIEENQQINIQQTNEYEDLTKQNNDIPNKQESHDCIKPSIKTRNICFPNSDSLRSDISTDSDHKIELIQPQINNRIITQSNAYQISKTINHNRKQPHVHKHKTLNQNINNSNIRSSQSNINSNDSVNINNSNISNFLQDNSSNNSNKSNSSSNISIETNPIISPHFLIMNHKSNINKKIQQITSPLKQSYIPDSPSTVSSINSDYSYNSLDKQQQYQLVNKNPISQDNSLNIDEYQSFGLDIGNNITLQQQKQNQQIYMQQMQEQNDLFIDNNINFQSLDQSQQPSSSLYLQQQQYEYEQYLQQQQVQEYSQQQEQEDYLYQLQQYQTFSSSQSENKRNLRKWKLHITN